MLHIFASYPTFLVFLAIVFAIAVTMVLMPAWIKFLKSSHIGQQVRADGPESHLVKQGTPTMGGVIMLVAVILTALVVGHPTPETFALLIATVLTGCLGLIDDAAKVVKERSLGLTPKAKLVGQFLISTVFGLVAVNVMGIAPTIEIPFIYTFDLGVLTTHFGAVEVPWLYIIFVDILLMGMCNAVNLTDGLDGLAAGTVMIVMIVMAAIAYRSDMLELGHLRRCARRRLHRLSLVQLVSRRYLHGRYGLACPWHGARAALRCSPSPSSSCSSSAACSWPRRCRS